MPCDAAPWHCHSFWLPKRGHTAEEYEDACAADVPRGRFAIADGASESSFARQWARLLVQGFVQAPAAAPDRWADWLPAQQECWRVDVGDKPLPWYAETKVQQGAFATFLGVTVEPSGLLRRPRWQAVAVGDSCCFHLRGERLRQAFPAKHSDEFGTAPWLVGSRTPPGEALDGKAVRAKGVWHTGDRLWLMTDALAQWFLQQVEAGLAPWQELGALLAAEDPHPAFAAWIERQREAHGLRNDDVTWLAISL
jgi:hypothetical protein